MIKIRIDDFPRGTPFEFYTNDKLKLLEKLEENKLNYYLGIVPQLTSNYDFKLLRNMDLKYCKFAMHGLDHGFKNWDICKGQSEYYFLKDKNEILNEFIESYKILMYNGLPIECFIPPFNVFNQQLVDILNDYNFKFITGGPESFDLKRMDINRINFGNLKFTYSTGKFYTHNGDFKKILSYIKDLPQEQHIVFHLNGEYLF